VFQACRCVGSTDSGMNDGEPPASIVQLINRVVTRFALAVVYVARLGAFTCEFSDYLLEEAKNAVFGDVDRPDHTARFDNRNARRVALE
jgi:hypothetical protein